MWSFQRMPEEHKNQVRFLDPAPFIINTILWETIMAYTKYTEVQYDQATFDQIYQFGVNLPYVAECVDKAQIMENEGKTPQVYATFGSLPRSFRRVWVDQASADEWKAFQIQTATNYGFVITNYEIGENV